MLTLKVGPGQYVRSRMHRYSPGFTCAAGNRMAERYGLEMTVLDWHAGLVCSGCGGRRVDFVVTGADRR
jgi:hypothetical protein